MSSYYIIPMILCWWKSIVGYCTWDFPLSPVCSRPYSSDSISILSYNMNALPYMKKDIDEIERYILKYDIVLLQECYTNIFHSKYNFLKRLSRYFYIFSEDYTLCSLKMESSGTVILSKFPIMDTSFKSFEGLYGFDCITNKGAMKATILINGQHVDVYNTHFQSDDDSPPYFCANQLREFVYLNSILTSRPIIIGGDFNMENIKMGKFDTIIPDEYTFEDKKLDMFMVRNLDVKEVGTRAFNNISDHNAVFIKVEL